MERSVLPIREEYDEELAFIICYPYPSREEYAERVRQLQQLGVEAIELAGGARLGRYRVLGKGFRGVVVLARVGGRRVALKIRRVDSERESLEQEALLTRIASGVGAGPEVYAWTKDFIVREYVEGKPLTDWILSTEDREALRRTLRELLRRAYALDAVGLDHGELSRPVRHVLITAEGVPYIIDYESASTARRPKNLTSLAQFIFVRRGKLREHVERLLGELDDEKVLAALREYKRCRSPRTFRGVLRALRLE